MSGLKRKPDVVKEQGVRFRKFFSRAWIPTTPEEKELFDSVEKVVAPYVESLINQAYWAGFDNKTQK